MLDGERFLILEYCPHSLADIIDQCHIANEPICQGNFYTWAAGIAEGLRFAHRNNHFHGDIKPPNIHIDDGNIAKLADFGLSSVPATKGATVRSNRGTARYMAPEQHVGAQLELEGLKKCDVWAFGIVLWEMMSRRNPFTKIEEHKLSIVIGTNDQ
ncbi:hypothetical protein PMAYCL1PPCAC_05656, partial [Pristionchus mayeri]